MPPRKYKKITRDPYRGYVSRDRARVIELEKELERAYKKIAALQKIILDDDALSPAQEQAMAGVGTHQPVPGQDTEQ